MATETVNTISRCVCFDRKVFERIEALRGRVPRSRYVSDILAAHLLSVCAALKEDGYCDMYAPNVQEDWDCDVCRGEYPEQFKACTHKGRQDATCTNLDAEHGHKCDYGHKQTECPDFRTL